MPEIRDWQWGGSRTVERDRPDTSADDV